MTDAELLSEIMGAVENAVANCRRAHIAEEAQAWARVAREMSDLAAYYAPEPEVPGPAPDNGKAVVQ